MLIFHEGLPGSGKSYEAVVKRIIPALAKGRAVQAYIEGLHYEKIAELAGISEEQCEALLSQFTREQMQKGEWLPLVKDNALLVFDEAQNFWPTGTKALSPELTQFVTEHRHRGLDVILMGQDIRDVHVLWRRRVDQKIVFQKLDTFGAPTRYKWSVFKGVVDSKGVIKYQQVQKGASKYEKRFFGTYRSHVSDDTNAETYKDSRAMIWNAPSFKYGVPIVCLVAYFSFNYVWGFFHGGAQFTKQKSPTVQSESKPASVSPGQQPAPVAVAPVQQSGVAAPAPAPAPPKVTDYIASISDRWRVRLSGLVEGGGRTALVLEWLDDGLHRRERLTGDELRKLGWQVEVEGGAVAKLTKGDLTVLATAWPIDTEGAISDRQLEEWRQQRESMRQRSQVEEPRVTVIPDEGGYTGPKRIGGGVTGSTPAPRPQNPFAGGRG